tara:strand:- start:8669 stop:9589 length:921 start_codon:yes stop_codon:yes gene_type:complete
MKKTLLVTGLSGFVGQHLKALFASPGAPVDWQLLQPSTPYDLCDRDSLQRLLQAGCPDAVMHLAGQTFVPEAFRDPAATFQVNLLGTLNLLESLKAVGFTGAFLYVSSGDIYGQVPEAELPIVESRLPQPRNPYGVSKVAAELLCLQWSCSEPWRIMVARPFNHIGAGQSESFVIASMARQLIRIKQGLQAPQLKVGDVDVTRDFLDVEDVIRGYLLLLEQGETGEVYNICSEKEHSVRGLIEEMALLIGVKVTLVQDSGRLRRAEQRRVVGSAEKLKQLTGWKPGVPIIETLRRVLSDWDNRDLQ